MVIWAEDLPNSFACMEKSRMYTIKGKYILLFLFNATQFHRYQPRGADLNRSLLDLIQRFAN